MVEALAANLGNDAALTLFDGTPKNPAEVAVEDSVAQFRERSINRFSK